MKTIGLNANELTALGLLSYGKHRSNMVEDVLNENFPEELQVVLSSMSKAEQVKFLEHQSIFQAVAEMIELNNKEIQQQLKSLDLVQK